MINLILAKDRNNGIGIFKNNEYSMPWNIPEDLKYFKEVTMDSVVIMGKNTWLSLNGPLSGRINIVVSKSLKQLEGCQVANSLYSAIKLAKKTEKKIFIIGGAQLYNQALKEYICDKLYITTFDIDTYANIKVDIPYYAYDQNSLLFVNYTEKNTEKIIHTTISEWKIKKEFKKEFKKELRVHEEIQYLDLVKNVLKNGTLRNNRTSVDAYSLFAPNQLRFSLENNTLPLLTTKKVFWRGVAEELFWFLSGSTDTTKLASKGVHIWDDNSTREFLDLNGLHNRNVGQLGPSYGHQWRRFGAEYSNNKSEQSDYTPESGHDWRGIDQISNLIHLIKTDPNSRRLILTAWNPSQLHEISLPSCHVLAQFYVEDGKLSCQMYQRSGDIGLGIPFNIASYSLLTILLAHCTGLSPGSFIHVIGDAHIYENHMNALLEQTERTPFEFPKLYIDSGSKDIFSLSFSDLRLEGYKYHDSIKMDMVV